MPDPNVNTVDPAVINSPEAEASARNFDTEATDRAPGASPKSPKRRLEYTHEVCETDGKMDAEMADRFYTDPDNVASLFCSQCNVGVRIGEDGEMVWKGSKDKVVPGEAPPAASPKK